MLASSLIIKKRDGHALTDDEIRFLINGFCRGDVADYQMSALAMAICLQGMDRHEITTLTGAMLDSGQRLPRSIGADCPRVDKHSTGGIGDKVSLILAPLLAACDVQVPMISGRGLGITGGTLDKLESIPGFQAMIDVDRSSQILADLGCFIIGADNQIAPADRQLYALRDVTGTVESIPLITASILSKKLAANLDALVMDVKVGSGAFMKDQASALELAQTLVSVAGDSGLPTHALLTDMDQPLGATIGNAIEVEESLAVLKGETINAATEDVRDLTIELCASLLFQVGAVKTVDAGRDRLGRLIDDGSAMERFEQMIAAQGGRLLEVSSLAPGHEMVADRSGYLSSYDCQALGEVVVAMGGGRAKKGDAIDHSVGLLAHHRIGDRVELGAPLVRIHCPGAMANHYAERVRAAIVIQAAATEPRPLVIDRIDSQSEPQSLER